MDWEFYIYEHKNFSLFKNSSTYKAVLLLKRLERGKHYANIYSGMYSFNEMRNMSKLLFDTTSSKDSVYASKKEISKYFNDLEKECIFLKGYYSKYIDFNFQEFFGIVKDFFTPWYDAG